MHNLAVGTDIYSHCRKYQQLETKMNFYDGNSDRKHTTEALCRSLYNILSRKIHTAKEKNISKVKKETNVHTNKRHPGCDKFNFFSLDEYKTA